jgi:hypothetical protein
VLLSEFFFALEGTGTFWQNNVCLALTGTKLFSGALLLFYPEEVIVGFQNFAWGINPQKKKIWDDNNFRGPFITPKVPTIA